MFTLAENKQKKKGLFRFYDSQKVGPGVKKEPESPRNLTYFFKLYWRNLSRIAAVNLLIIFGNFPVLFGLFGLTGNLNHTSTAPASNLFAQLYGASLHGGCESPAFMALFGIHGVQTELSVLTPATRVMFALTILVIFTFGFVNIGTTYILRNIVKGDPIFLMTDFFYAIKRNLRQGFIMGILDLLLTGVFLYNITLSYFNLSSFMVSVVFWANIALLLLYSVMRFYIYILIITFDLKLTQIIKNAFIFSIIGMKRNALAVTGIGLLMAINYSLLIVFMPLGIILPMIISLGTAAFMGAYAAYPKIKEIMIDPYYETDDPSGKKPTEIEPIFHDMG